MVRDVQVAALLSLRGHAARVRRRGGVGWFCRIVVRHTEATVTEKRQPEDEIVTGIEISSADMASLIADALVDGGVVRETDREKCERIAAEEIWIRKQLVDGHPGEGV